MTLARSVVAFLILAVVPLCGQKSKSLPANTIVFVCEHGAAKSVIAAAHFNRLAKEKGLPHRAITRGTNLDPEIPPFIRAGLTADGLDISGWTPRLLTEAEVRDGDRVITLGCALPSKTARKREEWNDIPNVGENYERAREAIVSHLNELVRTLAVK
ncbi:MAG TPA: hypothetical protein VGP79_05780 [Bryobacteraceae bacterium]|jgi:protein-tyrosine-phosphatase|nr:hypothetical protein [Bryobacteraceae bacterium]